MRQVSSTLGLAQLLGLSEWTVSRAINGHPEVKASTRERILKAMDEFGFRPNPVARGLSGKAMGIVGVCFGMARNALMMQKVTILDEFLRENSLRGILAIAPPDQASQIRIVEDFKHLRVDGMVLVQPYIGPSQLGKILEGIRYVLVDYGTDDLKPRVWLDRHKAMDMIVEHLWSLGHRSFGTLGFSDDSRDRWLGLKESLHARGASIERDVQPFVLAAPGLESFAEGIQLARLALAAPKRPTAFIAVNDEVAAGAMQEMRDRGIKIPADISIVGFSNFDVGQFLRPRLTTIDQQPALMMRAAGETLLSQLGSKPNRSANRCIDPVLIVRESTGLAKR